MIVAEEKYTKTNEDLFRFDVKRRIDRCHSREQDIELQAGQKIYMRSEDGSRWALTVSDAGALIVTAA